MKSNGLHIERFGAVNVTNLWQFHIEKNKEKEALDSLKELIMEGYDVSLADHSRGDSEGAYSFRIKGKSMEVTRGGHGYSSGPKESDLKEFEEIFEEMLPFNYGQFFANHGYIRKMS